MSHEANDGEDNESSKDAGAGVHKGDDASVTVAVVMELVVAGKGDEGAPAGTNGVEDLHGCLTPHLTEFMGQ
jgi:hypothetical protein